MPRWLERPPLQSALWGRRCDMVCPPQESSLVWESDGPSLDAVFSDPATYNTRLLEFQWRGMIAFQPGRSQSS